MAGQKAQTLVVDCDPQANSTGGLGFSRDPTRRSIYHGLMSDMPLEALIVQCEPEFLQLLPSDKDLVGATLELIDRPNRECALRQALTPIRDRFAFVLLDCPPALDLLTLNALVAADSVLIPVQCEYFALEE